MGQMRILGSQGHTTMTWDTTDETTVTETRTEFDKLMAANYLAFDVGADSQGSQQVKEFNPECEKLTIVPPMAGG